MIWRGIKWMAVFSAGVFWRFLLLIFCFLVAIGIAGNPFKGMY